jgi:hypothetical protein
MECLSGEKNLNILYSFTNPFIPQAKANGLMSMNRQLAANFNPNFNDKAFDRANRPFIDYRPTGKTPQPSNLFS